MDDLDQQAADEIRREASAFPGQKPDHRHQSVGLSALVFLFKTEIRQMC